MTRPDSSARTSRPGRARPRPGRARPRPGRARPGPQLLRGCDRDRQRPVQASRIRNGRWPHCQRIPPQPASKRLHEVNKGRSDAGNFADRKRGSTRCRIMHHLKTVEPRPGNAKRTKLYRSCFPTAETGNVVERMNPRKVGAKVAGIIKDRPHIDPDLGRDPGTTASYDPRWETITNRSNPIDPVFGGLIQLTKLRLLLIGIGPPMP